ncbi:MAG: DUF177 domain-containing protein [Candidatus Omnitrophica bacterium]|nr:DUF177 domain-containing protein [Candidatus Omnitrophota bacterium]MBU0878651.1 DUF177 domain-containing protein [Candidatus Omnitrophota bacterium]MBU0896266.1 DUF177 domain-containing protein [Candidatus Omnitrophota bacterium]MBU1134183.1 DUF177 domain-containing protein [Candidatus Omnitrophota bacterium]MBU1366390.1 DUF177 domain-containing protein [Candidatus Omnitrophota bacterium]
MKVEVEKIRDKEIEIEENIPACSWDMDSSDINFVDDIHLDCKFIKAGREIKVNAYVAINRLITCSRCLERVKQTKKQEFKLSYSINKLKDYLEVDEDIREQVLLNFPMKVLCKPDCKGLCSICGANLNFQECQCYKKSKCLPAGRQAKW